MTRRTSLGFLVLCLLSASGWLLEEATTLPFSGLPRLALHLGLIAAVLGFTSPRSAYPPRSSLIALWSAALVAPPLVVATAAAGHLTNFGSVLVFALVPAFTIFFVSLTSASFGEDRSPLSLLPWALAGFGGLALLVPFVAPVSAVDALWLAAILLAGGLSAYAGVRLHSLFAGIPGPRSAAILSGSAAIAIAAFCWLPGTARPTFSLRGLAIEAAVCLLLDAPVILLTAWLLRELSPVAFSSRFLIVPLVTITEGVVLLRPDPTWVMLLGAALIVGGALFLLREGHQS